MARIWVQHCLQEPNMDQHRRNIGSTYAGGTEPLRWHGHVQHGNRGSQNATRCASAVDYCHYACNQLSQNIRQKNFSAYSHPSVYHPISLSLTLSTGSCPRLHLKSSALSAACSQREMTCRSIFSTGIAVRMSGCHCSLLPEKLP